MKWLTNRHQAEVATLVGELQRGHEDNPRRLTRGVPRATEDMTVDELKDQGMVGVYEEGTP